MRLYHTLKFVLTVMVFLSPALPVNCIPEEAASPGISDSFDRIQVPFIPNQGQIDNKEAAYYAKILSGYIYVDKNGKLTHSVPSETNNGLVINEIFTEKKVTLTPLDPPSETAVEVFRKRGQITGTVSNYYRLSYGAIYNGIELQLMAFIDGLEKIFTIVPGGDPNTITVTLKDIEGLKVNDAGMLEIITQQGSATLSKPHAYQFIAQERKAVDVSYLIRKNDAYGFKLGSYDKTKPLIIAPDLPAFLLTQSVIQ